MATRGRFIPGQPLSVSQLNEMNRVADSGKPRVLGSSVDVASGESGMAIQPTGTPSSTLRILKVTGTVTGGYSFQEVYDPNGDGTYTDAKGYVSVGTSMFLVAKSGVTLATNDIVVARLNPYNSSRWEWLATLAVASAGSALSTSNTDGTQSGTTTDMRFDKSTGIGITQGGSFDTVANILAGSTQRGVMGITGDGAGGLQRLGGRKVLRDTGGITGLGITSDANAQDYNGGTVLANLFADSSLVNLADGVYSTGASDQFKIVVNTHDTITVTTSLVDYSRVLIQAEHNAGGSIDDALVQVTSYDSTINQIVTCSMFSRNDLYVTGVAIGGGSPDPGTSSNPIIYYDYNTPSYAWRINSDLTFNASVGPVIRSPNGNRWRIKVDNAGVLSTTGPL